MSVATPSDDKTRRLAFVQGRRRPAPGEIEQSNLAAARRSAATRRGSVLRELFETRRRLLITVPHRLDDGDIVRDGARVVESLETFRKSATLKHGCNTQCFDDPIEFAVGARHFGVENQRFHFPDGYELVKQGRDKVTIASPGVRVTFIRVGVKMWHLDGVMRPEAERTGTTTVRGMRNRNTHTIRH